jgi:hypothetical protein
MFVVLGNRISIYVIHCRETPQKSVAMRGLSYEQMGGEWN